jgi:chromosomal replication initiation ATPase DnaA
MERTERVLKTTGQVCSVPAAIIRDRFRQPTVSRARAVAAIVMRDALGLSSTQIAEVLKRSHSSVLELVASYENHQQVQKDVAEVKRRLGEPESALAAETESALDG